VSDEATRWIFEQATRWIFERMLRVLARAA
jgi:hypothetical protein